MTVSLLTLPNEILIKTFGYFLESDPPLNLVLTCKLVNDIVQPFRWKDIAVHLDDSYISGKWLKIRWKHWSWLVTLLESHHNIIMAIEVRAANIAHYGPIVSRITKLEALQELKLKINDRIDSNLIDDLGALPPSRVSLVVGNILTSKDTESLVMDFIPEKCRAPAAACTVLEARTTHLALSLGKDTSWSTLNRLLEKLTQLKKLELVEQQCPEIDVEAVQLPKSVEHFALNLVPTRVLDIPLRIRINSLRTMVCSNPLPLEVAVMGDVTEEVHINLNHEFIADACHNYAIASNDVVIRLYAGKPSYLHGIRNLLKYGNITPRAVISISPTTKPVASYKVLLEELVDTDITKLWLQIPIAPGLSTVDFLATLADRMPKLNELRLVSRKSKLPQWTDKTYGSDKVLSYIGRGRYVADLSKLNKFKKSKVRKRYPNHATLPLINDGLK